MTINEQVKILDGKIKANKAQNDLELIIGEDLGYKPDVVKKAKFDYSPLGQVFNKGLDVSEKNEGLLKRLKNIEGKNEQQLDLIRDQGEKQSDLIGKINTDKTKRIGFYDKGNKKAVEVVNKILKR